LAYIFWWNALFAKRTLTSRHEEKQTMVKNSNGRTHEETESISLGIAIGAGLGVALGVVFGIVLDNMAFMGVGIAIGVGAGIAVSTSRSERNKQSDA
jgi:F0F1-type ATP synthase assembly protein I